VHREEPRSNDKQREETEERHRETERERDRCNTRGAVKTKAEMSASSRADFL